MMSAPASVLPEEILLLIIRAYVDSVPQDRHLCECRSLRLVSSFFNDSIIHPFLPARKGLQSCFRTLEGQTYR